MAGFLKRFGPVVALWAATATAQIADPTRPPPGLDQRAGGQAEPVTTNSGLQSILRPRQGKPRVLIDGQWVELGGRIGEARVVRIGTDSVRLRSAAGDEELKLMPNVEKRVVEKSRENAEGHKKAMNPKEKKP